MKREINKSHMINDIVLTISLIVSVIITKLIMSIGDVTENKSAIFFILTFINIKVTYNAFLKITRNLSCKK